MKTTVLFILLLLMFIACTGKSESSGMEFLALMGSGSAEESVEPPEPRPLTYQVGAIPHPYLYRNSLVEVPVHVSGGLPVTVRPFFVEDDDLPSGVRAGTQDIELRPGDTFVTVPVPSDLDIYRYSGPPDLENYRLALCPVKFGSASYYCANPTPSHMTGEDSHLYSTNTVSAKEIQECSTPCSLTASWNHNRASRVHTAEGGYILCYSKEADFEMSSGASTTCESIPYTSGPRAPDSKGVVITEPGVTFFRVQAFARINGDITFGRPSSIEAVLVEEP